MAKTRDYMDYLDEKIEIAPANSQEEYQAASTIADLMRDHGLEPQIEEFETYSWGKLLPAVVVIVMFVCLIVTGVTEGVPHIVTLLLSLASVALLLVSHYLRNIFETLGPTKRSQNVVALHHASGDKVVKGARPIVIVAHYDTPRASLLRKGALARVQAALWNSSIVCVIIIAVSLILQAIPLFPTILRTIFWVVSLIAALPLLLLSVLSIIDHFGTCTLGANDNKSSVAAMLSIMNNVCPAEDRVDGVFDGASLKRRESDPEPQPAGPVRREVVEEVVGVRHGREILSDLNILPASCEIVYEAPKVQVVEEYPEDLVTTSVAKSAAVISDASDDDQKTDKPEIEEWEDEGYEDEEYVEDSGDEDADELAYEEEDDEAWDEDQSFEDDGDEFAEDEDAADEETFEDELGEEEELDSEPVRSEVRGRGLHRVLPLVGEDEEDEDVDFAEDESYEEESYEDDEYEEDEEYEEGEEDSEYDEDSEGFGSVIGEKLKAIWAVICAFFVGVVAKIKGLFSKKSEDAEGEWEEDALLEDDEQDSWEDEGVEETYDEADFAYEEQYEEDYADYDDQATEAVDEEFVEDEFVEDESYVDDYNDESAEVGFEDDVAYEEEAEQDAYLEYGDYDDDEAYADYGADYEFEEQADELVPYDEEEQAIDQDTEAEPEPGEEAAYAYEDEYEEDVIAQGGYEQAPAAPQGTYDSAAEDDYYEDDLYEDDLYSDDDFAVLEEDYEEESDVYGGEVEDIDAPYAQVGEEEPLDGAYDEWEAVEDDSIDGAYEEEYEGDYEEYVEEEPAKESIGTKILKAFRRLGGRSQEEEPYEDSEYVEEDGYYGDEDAAAYEDGEYVEEDYAYQEGEDALIDDEAGYDEPYAEGAYAEDEYDYEEVPEGDEYDSYDSDYDQQGYPEQGVHARFADPNELHFDREEDADIVPRDTTGLDTISETYDLIPQEASSSPRREPPASIDDPNWGVSSYRPTPPAHNIARRAVLFDLPDPSASELDPLAGDEYDGYESEDGERLDNGETAYHDSYETPYEDEYYDYGDSSLDDIMEQSRDFTDRESARRSATYEDDSRRDNDGRDNQSRSFWKGGASVRADLRDDDSPIVIDEADLQDTILEMGDDFLRGHDVWFVATGASSQNHAGIKAFLAEHRRDIRGSFLINLESIGAGSLSLLVNEGLHAPRRADRRLVRMLKDVAEDLHINLEQAIYNWDETEAATGMRSRIRSVTIMGLNENDLPALSRTQDDVPQNVNPDMVSSVVRLVTEFIRRS